MSVKALREGGLKVLADMSAKNAFFKKGPKGPQ